MVTAVLYGRTGSASVFRQYRFLYSVHRMIRVSGIQDNPEQSYYLNLGSTTAGAKPIPYRLTVTRGGYPAPWDSLKCSANAADLALDLNQKGKNNWLLTLLPKNLAILGSQSYMLRFSFYQKGKELRYHFSEPVNFKVRGPLEMEPDSVFFGAVPYGSTVVKHLQLVTSATGEIGKGRIVSATSTDPTHAVASIINGGKGLRVAFHAVHVRGRTTGRFLVTAEYGGSRYQFREDYLAYVGKQRPKAKVR